MTRFSKVFYLCLGWLCVALGFVGIIFPLSPTAPFLIVAVWAFSRASPALAEKLRQHPLVGPPISNWQDHGAIPRYGKVAAVVMMSAVAVYLFFISSITLAFSGIAGAVMIAAGWYVVTRPSPPKQN